MKYHVAQNPGDYQRVHALMRREGVDKRTLRFPTIMAFDEKGTLVGAIGTEIESNMIIGGPLVMDSTHRRPFTALRLIELYEGALRNIGIQSYILPISNDEFTAKIAKRYYPHVEPYAEQDGYKFYIRKLDGSQEAMV